MSQLLLAIQYADQKHKGQYRKKNGRPFISHPLEVLRYIAVDDKYGDEISAVIAVLHDVVEDCAASDSDADRSVLSDEIRSKFGPMVTIGVEQLTNEYTHSRYPETNRKVRKKLEMTRLSLTDPRTKTIKLYDRLVNIQDMVADEDWNITYAKESWVLASALAVPETYHIAAKIMRLAAQIVKKAKK